MNKKVIVISPNPKSFYTTSVCDLLLKEGIHIQAIIVKKFTYRRYKQEFSRDGLRLLKKIWKKLILRKNAYSKYEKIENIISFRKKLGIHLNDIRDLKSNNVLIHFVDDLNSSFMEKEFKKLSPDLVVFTGGGLIRESLIKHSGDGIVNCHMGILPMYRGMDVVEWPIINDDFKNIGMTTHFMAKGIDTGDILLRKNILIGKDDTIHSLRVRFEPHMVELMVNTVLDYFDGKIIPEPQNIQEGKQYFILEENFEKLAKEKLKLFSAKL